MNFKEGRQRDFVLEETQRQANMEAIIEKSLPLLEQDSSPESMDNDWVANFFDKCRLFSDEEVQQLWAFVLSGEANSPGTFSRQTVNILANLDEDHIKLFEALSKFHMVYQRLSDSVGL